MVKLIVIRVRHSHISCVLCTFNFVYFKNTHFLYNRLSLVPYSCYIFFLSNVAVKFQPLTEVIITYDKKLCYREEHSASVVLSWCTLCTTYINS